MHLHLIPPEDITAAELQAAVNALRVHLIAQPDGSVLGLPISPTPRQSEPAQNPMDGHRRRHWRNNGDAHAQADDRKDLVFGYE